MDEIFILLAHLDLHLKYLSISCITFLNYSTLLNQALAKHSDSLETLKIHFDNEPSIDIPYVLNFPEFPRLKELDLKIPFCTLTNDNFIMPYHYRFNGQDQEFLCNT